MRFKWLHMKERVGKQRTLYISEKLEPYLRKGDNVLDLFCGYSPLYDLVIRKGCHITGVDGYNGAVEWLNKECPKGEWLFYIFEAYMPYDMGADVLLLLGVAEPQHTPEWRSYFNKLLDNNNIRVIITDTATPPSPRPYYTAYQRNKRMLLEKGYSECEGQSYTVIEPIPMLREYAIYLKD